MRVLPALLLLAPAMALAQEPIPGANYPQPLYSTTNTWQPIPFGIFNDATSLSANINPRGLAEVNGFHSPSEMASFPERGAVTLYAGAYAPPPLATAANASYTATQLIPSAPLDAATIANIQKAVAQCIRNVRVVCMMIDTKHVPKYTGSITAVATDGSSVTVSGWYRQGNTAAGQVPANGFDALINPITKIWNINGVSKLNADSLAQESAFIEGDIYNYQASYAGTGTVLRTLGISMNCDGPSDCSYANLALNNWFTGFAAKGNTYAGFQVQGISGGTQTPFGYVSNVSSASGHHPFIYIPSDAPVANTPVWSVSSNGNTQVGDTVSANGMALQAATPGNPPIIQAIGVDSNIDLRLIPKGTGGVVRTPTTFRSTATTTSGLHPFEYVPSDGSARWSVNNVGGMILGDPLVNNGMNLTVSAPGTPAIIQAAGPDTNIDIRLAPKGTGAVRNSGDYVSITPTTQAGHPILVQPSDTPGKTTFSMGVNGSTIQGDTTTVNGMAYSIAAAGSPPIIQALGVDTNIDLRLVAKGTGAVRVTGQLNTSSGTLETPTTVAGLGTCTTALKGKRWAVTDATAQSFGATLVGGGAVTTAAFCNGAAWINM